MTNTNRKLNKFLDERGLKKSYRKYQKIKYKRRQKLVIDGERLNVYIYKKKGKTHVVNAYDLKEIVTTKKYNTKQVGKQLEKNNLTPKFISQIRYKNFTLERSKSIRRTKVGQVLVNLTATKGKQKQTVEEMTGFTVPLVSKNERVRAEQKAVERCMAQLNFYDPSDIQINFIHYIYSVKDDTLRR